jgi:hypothetical protein
MFPILVICMMMAIQVSMDYYAKEVALGAADAGVHAARLSGNPQDGVAAAKEYLHEHAGWLVTNDTNVDTSQSTATQIVITIQGQPPTILGPLAHIVTVSETSSGAIEQFTTTGTRP